MSFGKILLYSVLFIAPLSSYCGCLVNVLTTINQSVRSNFISHEAKNEIATILSSKLPDSEKANKIFDIYKNERLKILSPKEASNVDAILKNTVIKKQKKQLMDIIRIF